MRPCLENSLLASNVFRRSPGTICCYRSLVDLFTGPGSSTFLRRERFHRVLVSKFSKTNINIYVTIYSSIPSCCSSRGYSYRGTTIANHKLSRSNRLCKRRRLQTPVLKFDLHDFCASRHCFAVRDEARLSEFQDRYIDR